LGKKYKYILLIIIPVLFFISGNLLKEAQGPYYLNFYDPSYVYLVSSLNLAQLEGYGVGHFDHPGTTVQVAGAVILSAYHLISSKSEELVHDVLKRPEDYLKVINRIFGLINTVFLILLGSFVLKVTGNIIYSLLIQLSPFVSMEVFYGYIIVTPDNFLIFITLCMIGACFYYLYSVKESPESPYSLVFIFALISAAGMATKLNFFPMTLIPLLLIQGVKRKLIFAAASVLLFHVFIFPAISNYAMFTEWISRLIIYDGHYGQGDPTVVNSSEFFMHLELVFTKDLFFTFSYLIMILTLSICLFSKNKIEKGTDDLLKKQLKLLFIIFIAVTFQIIIVAKQYRQHYMIPSFIISVFALSLCAQILAFHFEKLKVKYSYMIIIVILSVWALYQVNLNYNLGMHQRNEAFKIVNYISENYPDKFLISTYSTANSQTAMAFAVSYAGSQTERYRTELRKQQKNLVFYNPWIKQFESIAEKNEIKKLIPLNQEIIVQITEYGIHDLIKNLDQISGVSNSKFTKVFINGNGEALYEVRTGDK